MTCRFCGTPLTHSFVDLGEQPLSNGYLQAEDLDRPELCHPLNLFVCANCFLVQVAEYASGREIFDGGYRYFSSFSATWLAHAESFARRTVEHLGLGPDSLVVEVASNDGYLLQYFKEMNVPCLGIEPATATADAARARGIEVLGEFFGKEFATELVRQGRRADLLIGNNVLAHVPDLNDFVSGLETALAPNGTVSVEFPHLLKLLEETQFDTIYHEHFSYFSFATARRVFEAHGLTVTDVEELPTHGGSLRVWAMRKGDALAPHRRVGLMLYKEAAAGLDGLDAYHGFQGKVDGLCAAARAFVEEQKDAGRTIAGYGAAAKGNTFLNTCGLGADDIAFVADASEHKQGLYLPGSHIPVVAPEVVFAEKPDWLVILPWNIREEIIRQMRDIKAWGGRFMQFIPSLIIH